MALKLCLYVKRRTEEGKCRQLEVNKIWTNFATRYFHLVSVFEQQRICLKTMLAGKENQKFLLFIVESVEKIFSKNNTSVFRCLEQTEECNFSHGSKTGKQILQELTEDFVKLYRVLNFLYALQSGLKRLRLKRF